MVLVCTVQIQWSWHALYRFDGLGMHCTDSDCSFLFSFLSSGCRTCMLAYQIQKVQQ